MASLSQDPFYIVRQEIQDTVNELQSRMSRFHGLTAANPERKAIANVVVDGCESLKWQVMDVIKKSGTTTQLGVIAFLMIVLILLSVWAFM